MPEFRPIIRWPPSSRSWAEHTKVGERSARLYVAHLQRFAAWLELRYQAPLLDATTRDLREYRAELAQRQKPASVNAAPAALRRFYGWATDTDVVAKIQRGTWPRPVPAAGAERFRASRSPTAAARG